jgi:ATP-binding cassette subfamily B protein
MTHIRAIADEVTVLAITHRKSVIMSEDQIVRLNDGRVLMENS